MHGKTSLVQAFTRAVADDPRAVVLAGRCYERESVPYKAIDSLVDALARYLAGRSPHGVAAILPRFIGDEGDAGCGHQLGVRVVGEGLDDDGGHGASGARWAGCPEG